jgi:hypothetical protein
MIAEPVPTAAMDRSKIPAIIQSVDVVARIIRIED